MKHLNPSDILILSVLVSGMIKFLKPAEDIQTIIILGLVIVVIKYLFQKE
jgi:hypothetical protein